MPCSANAIDKDGNEVHCCWTKGQPCKFLIENHTDENGYFRRWACSLRAKYGNWDDVLADPEYQALQKWAWRPGLNCRDWPDGEPGTPNWGVCPECGVNSD